jgi:hypothetical protein
MTEFPTREQVERRLHALVADWLDIVAEDNSDGFDVGVVGFIGEVVTPDPEYTVLRREEGGYTPAMDTHNYFSYYCSDHRWYIKRAIFGDAGDYFRYPPADSDEDEEANGDED